MVRENIFERFNNFRPIFIRWIWHVERPKIALWDIEFKLNRVPDEKWTEFYKNPHPYTPSIGPGNVIKDKIVARCEKSAIASNYEWIEKYVEQANKQYLEFKECKKQKELEKKKQQKDKEELKN